MELWVANCNVGEMLGACVPTGEDQVGECGKLRTGDGMRERQERKRKGSFFRGKASLYECDTLAVAKGIFGRETTKNSRATGIDILVPRNFPYAYGIQRGQN